MVDVPGGGSIVAHHRPTQAVISETEASMSDIRFDPSKAVTFDLDRGLVQLGGTEPRVLVPAEALSTLCDVAGPTAAAAFGRAVGEAMGERVAERLAGEAGVNGASVGVVVEHVGGELSLGGMGSLSLERWGRALVLVIDRCPLGARGDGLLESVLGGALGRAAGKSVRSLFLGREEARARFLITGDAGLSKVTSLLADGMSWGEALVKLHAGPPAASSRGDA